MKLFKWSSDGGSDSGVMGLYLIEIKKLFSVVLLHFRDGSREAYHNHAFNAVSWVLRGGFIEQHLNGETKEFTSSPKPKFTSRSCFHKVVSNGETWVLSFRGPWKDTWKESRLGKLVTLTHGRKIVG
jgi:hypothetical protein